MCKALRSWCDTYIYRSKTVPLTTKCKRVHMCAAQSWIHKMRTWEAQILRLTFRPRRRPHETWEGYKTRTSRFMRVCWRKMGLPLLTEKIASKIWTTTTWAVFDGDVPVLQALRSILGWRTTAWRRSRSSWSMTWDPYNLQRWKHKVGFHNGHTDGEMGG